MYGWIFRHLPGNLFWRWVQALVLVGAVVAALFVWVFPWMADTVPLLGTDPNMG